MATTRDLYAQNARHSRGRASRYREKEAQLLKTARGLKEGGVLRDVAERGAKTWALRAELEDRIAAEFWEKR